MGIFDNSEATILDSNGQKYRVGWDNFGYFTIQMVELRAVPEHGETGDLDTVTYNGDEYTVQTVGDYPNTSIEPGSVNDLMAVIEEGL